MVVWPRNFTFRGLAVRLRPFLALVVLAGAAAVASPALTPQDVASSIARSGARTTLDRIYKDETQWVALLSGIAAGEPVWLNLAKQLRRVSDGGATEQIELAAGEALEHRPADVLSLVADEFGIAGICGGPDVDDPRFDSYDLSMAAILRRQEMLRAIRDPSLIRKRDACMLELDKAKADFAHFYGRGA